MVEMQTFNIIFLKTIEMLLMYVYHSTDNFLSGFISEVQVSLRPFHLTVNLTNRNPLRVPQHEIS